MTRKEMLRVLINFKVKRYLSDGGSIVKYDTSGDLESVTTKIVDDIG